jgi:hypothetical protein
LNQLLDDDNHQIEGSGLAGFPIQKSLGGGGSGAGISLTELFAVDNGGKTGARIRKFGDRGEALCKAKIRLILRSSRNGRVAGFDTCIAKR